MGSRVSSTSRRSRETTPGALESCIGSFSPFRTHHTRKRACAASARCDTSAVIVCLYSCRPVCAAAMPPTHKGSRQLGVGDRMVAPGDALLPVRIGACHARWYADAQDT